MTTGSDARQRVRELIEAASGRVHDSTTWHWSDDYDEPSLLDELVQNIVAVFEPSPHPNTVKVRIPVVTTHDCRHFAYRSHEDTDSEADEYIRGRLCAAGSIVSWITADVPLPSPPVEVKGTVEQ